MIDIKGLNIKYNKRIILNSSDLAFRKGKIYAIVGESGSGKSSILTTIGQLQKQTIDTFIFGGNDLLKKDYSSSLQKNYIGYIFQDKNLFDSMNIEENMKTYAHIVNKKDVKFNELFNLVNLKVVSDRLVYTLSGGEKQRLSIACALIKDPEIILADEPTSGLDEKNANLVIEILEKLAHEYNKCVIISTHSQIIKDQCDYIYEIKNKKITAKDHSEMVNLKIKKTRTKFKFYAHYLMHSKLILKKLYIGLMILLSISLSLLCTITKLRNDIQQNSEDLLNSNALCDFIVYKEEATNEDLKYLSEIFNVSDSQFLYQSDDIKYAIYSLNQKPINEMNDREIYVTLGFARHKGYDIGDSIYLESLQKEFTITKILEEQFNAYFDPYDDLIFVSNQYFKEITSNFIMIHINDFTKIDSVVEQIEQANKSFDVFSTPFDYQILNDYQMNLISVLNYFGMGLTGIFIILAIVIEWLDMESHKYEFALLRANGITKLELIRLIFYRLIIQLIFLVCISTLFALCLNVIYYQMNFTKTIKWYQGINQILPFSLFIVLSGNIISVANIISADPEKLLRND